MAGRPREFDRRQALAKARDAFWARGFEGVTMADLVEALGIASARIYAAFGSKERLFREAVALYDAEEGGFAARALAGEPTARGAIERLLRDAVDTYTRPDRPGGCMVVGAGTNCTRDNAGIADWLAELRRQRTASLIARLERAQREGELPSHVDVRAVGDHFATVLHGLSVQARDGVSRQRLLSSLPMALRAMEQAGSETPS